MVENTPLELTAMQRQVLEALQSKQTAEYPLGNWYLGALYALQNQYNPDRISQAAQSLRELLEKLPRVIKESDVVRSYDLQGQRRNISKRFRKDKEHYDGKWKDKIVNGHLDKTLRKIDSYLELNRRPTRKEQIQSAIGHIDPMSNMFDPDIQEEKRDKFHGIWQDLEGFAHHRSKLDKELFMKRFSEVERTILDLLAPITAQDQQEIRSILKKPTPTEADISSMLTLLKRRGANYVFFFKHANAAWLPILKEKGFFQRPLDVEPANSEGYVTFRLWWPVLYLQRIVSNAPDQVVDILVALPKTENPHVLRAICEIACTIENIELSLKLKPWVIRYIKSSYGWIQPKMIANLLNQWSGESKDSLKAALELLKIVVPFSADPMSEEKQAHHLENPQDWTISLEPAPCFNKWEYQEILENGVRPLADSAPYQVANILINASASMIRLSKFQEDLDKEGDEDSLEIWVERLNHPAQDYLDSKAILIRTLTFVCEKVYENSPESVEGLDQALRNQRWKLFKRLRQHLYVLHPSTQTLPWIREFILEYNDHAKREYGYEFQLMVRNACEHFGSDLLNSEERTTIFDAILSGPSRDDFRKKLILMGGEFTEERFQQRQRYFHRKQLRPFARLLTGEYLSYFQELKNAFEAYPISDEEYLRIKDRGSGLISSRSPRSPEHLARLQDEELLAYINEWQDEHRDQDDWLVEITINSLADEFQTVFKDAILSNEDRLTFWIENCARIERPVYVEAIVKAIQAHVTEQQYKQLDLWFAFCEWVLSHPDEESNDGVQLHDNSREHPNWRNSRRSVGDFIGACLDKNVNVPLSARRSLARLLGLLCNQFDGRLDHNMPVVLNINDPLTEAINNTRSRALEDLVNFGFWVRRHDSTDSVPEVTAILEERFKADAEHPLTMPEHALLGKNYGRLYELNQTWAVEYKAAFFPRNNLPVWVEAFGSFLQFNPPFSPIFEILKEDYRFALNHLAELNESAELIDTLGKHLFVYYLWGVYPLNGKDSLLEKFYQKTTEDRQQWTRLFTYVERSLRNIGKDLEADFKDRIVAFFNWRLEVKESEELRGFTFRLQESECFDSDWCLDAYSKILDLSLPDDEGIFLAAIDALNEMLKSHPAQVVECFTKITEIIDQNPSLYISADKAKPIVVAGLNSADESVRKNAERAKENLLRGGYYDLLDT